MRSDGSLRGGARRPRRSRAAIMPFLRNLIIMPYFIADVSLAPRDSRVPGAPSRPRRRGACPQTRHTRRGTRRAERGRRPVLAHPVTASADPRDRRESRARGLCGSAAYNYETCFTRAGCLSPSPCLSCKPVGDCARLPLGLAACAIGDLAPLASAPFTIDPQPGGMTASLVMISSFQARIIFSE
jgi:hypothetical protein